MELRLVLMKTLATGSIAWLVAAASLRAGSPSSGAGLIVPRETKVLLLQPIDGTADSATLAPLRQEFIRLRQQYEFISRGFTVLGEAMAAKAATAPPALDLQGDASGRPAGLLDELGRRADADWVVSIVVREIKTDPSGGTGFKVHSSLLIQIRDARRHAWLANGPYIGHLTGSGAPGRLFIASLRSATGEALAGILTAYPPVVPVARDGSIVDYLAGQSAPFVGDPGAPPFHGLKAAGAN
jgi:hypothetical protein